MKLNKLLEKQLKKFLPEELRGKEELQLLLKAVSESYNAYERDIELSAHAFRMSEEEYREINSQLNSQVELNKASVKELKDAIAATGDSALNEINDKNELLNIAAYLNSQIAILRDTEKKLHDQKQFYERILNHIPANIAILDKEHRYLFVNPHAIKNPDIREWIIGKTNEEYMAYRNRPIEASDERRRYFDAAVQSRTRTEWEEKIVGKDGTVEYNLVVLYPVFDDRGDLDMMVIYGVNITERKKADEQIRLSEARYKSIFNNGQALICTHDINGKLLEVNNASLAAFGYSKEELTGANLYMLLPPDRRAEFEQGYIPEIKNNGKASGIMVALNKAGKKIYLLYQNYLVTDDTEEPYVIGFSQDITARIDAERALKMSEEKYRSIIANMNLGLLEVDHNEHIVYANNSFCEMSGYQAHELAGKSASALLLTDESYLESGKITKATNPGDSDAYELKVKNKRGEPKWWLISGAPSFDSNGRVKGSIGIYLDITVQKNLEYDLRKAKSEAERSAHAKELFLASMSHEIRTPMNAILGIGRLLSKTQLEPQQKTYQVTIQNAANNLLVLINDLLDFSKIEAGKISLENIGFELTSVLQNSIQVLGYKAEEKGLLINYQCAPGIVPVLVGDPYRINQVLMNLLGNSIKFTEKGSVKIECAVVDEGATWQKVMFKVIDTGIGISKDYVDHLFDKFTQEDESITRKFGGTGLGMSICKQLIDLMGGDIHVDSKKNFGTTISFTLKLLKGTVADLPDRQQASIDTQILKGKRILLVEDNETNRLLANTILSQFGAHVTEAENGNVAIDKFRSASFDLVLMDVMMPVKDGLETTKFIRSKIDKSIPIIALTANALKKEEERCIAAGMNDFISKPFDENKMVQLVAQWLGKEVHISSFAVVENKDQEQLFCLDKIKSISRGDDGFVNKMLELFIATIPETVAEMEAAYEEEDWKAMSALAHRVKPSLDNMGITSLATDIRAIEYYDPEHTGQLGNCLKHIRSVLDEVIAQLKDILSAAK